MLLPHLPAPALTSSPSAHLPARSVQSIVAKTQQLSCHTFGCRLVQRVLEHCTVDVLREVGRPWQGSSGGRGGADQCNFTCLLRLALWHALPPCALCALLLVRQRLCPERRPRLLRLSALPHPAGPPGALPRPAESLTQQCCPYLLVCVNRLFLSMGHAYTRP